MKLGGDYHDIMRKSRLDAAKPSNSLHITYKDERCEKHLGFDLKRLYRYAPPIITKIIYDGSGISL